MWFDFCILVNVENEDNFGCKWFKDVDVVDVFLILLYGVKWFILLCNFLVFVMILLCDVFLVVIDFFLVLWFCGERKLLLFGVFFFIIRGMDFCFSLLLIEYMLFCFDKFFFLSFVGRDINEFKRRKRNFSVKIDILIFFIYFYRVNLGKIW